MPSRLWFERALLPTGWAHDVAIELAGGVVASLRIGAPPNGAERHATAIPGLCNVHSHTFQRGMAGLAESRGPVDDNFWTWRAWMYKFLDRLGPDDIQAIAAQAFMEMLEGGFTRVGEFHYLHHAPDGTRYDNLAETAERICSASADADIGLTLLPVYYAQGGFGAAAPTPGQRRFLNDPARFEALFEASRAALSTLEDARIGLAPHSLRAVSAGDLERLVAAHPEGPIHIHVAEQAKEVADCLAWSGQRPVAWLLDRCDVDARWCLIHATHVEPVEIQAIARRGAVVGLCPLTEANLGDGVFPARDFLAAGGRFGIGTDSNVQIDAASELRAMEYAQRLQLRARNVLGARDTPSTGAALFAAAHRGGAQALDDGGGLVVGGSADIVSFDPASTVLCGRSEDASIDSWIFAGREREIDCVWRRGRKVVEGGRHRDRTRIGAAYRAVVQQIAN